MRKEAAALRVLTNTFLHHHWQLRTTVDFVSNILAQNARDVVNDSVKAVVKSVLEIENISDVSNQDATNIYKLVSDETSLSSLIASAVQAAMSTAMTDVRRFCHERASHAIRAMVKKDVSEDVLETAIQIAENRASTSVQLLVTSNVRYTWSKATDLACSL